MKAFILFFTILGLASCSSMQRDPSSVQKEDISEGVNTDYYGNW